MVEDHIEKILREYDMDRDLYRQFAEKCELLLTELLTFGGLRVDVAEKLAKADSSPLKRFGMTKGIGFSGSGNSCSSRPCSCAAFLRSL